MKGLIPSLCLSHNHCKGIGKDVPVDTYIQELTGQRADKNLPLCDLVKKKS